MNRRLFLQNMGLAGFGVALAPLISFDVPKRTIYKCTQPVFKMLYHTKDNNGKMLWVESVVQVNTRKGTLQDVLDRYPDDEIFFYQEATTEFVEGHKINYVRSAVIHKRPEIKIMETEFYKRIIV